MSCPLFGIIIIILRCVVVVFYKTPFCCTRFLEHEERSDECYKANKCDKMAYKTSIIQLFFLFYPLSSKHNARKIIFGKYKGW
jgi:hypothetical protein